MNSQSSSVATSDQAPEQRRSHYLRAGAACELHGFARTCCGVGELSERRLAEEDEGSFCCLGGRGRSGRLHHFVRMAADGFVFPVRAAILPTPASDANPVHLEEFYIEELVAFHIFIFTIIAYITKRACVSRQLQTAHAVTLPIQLQTAHAIASPLRHASSSLRSDGVRPVSSPVPPASDPQRFAAAVSRLPRARAQMTQHHRARASKQASSRPQHPLGADYAWRRGLRR